MEGLDLCYGHDEALEVSWIEYKLERIYWRIRCALGFHDPVEAYDLDDKLIRICKRCGQDA